MPDGGGRLMQITFGEITELPRGSLHRMLADAYSFDSRCAAYWEEQWREFDDFFYDRPEIAVSCGFITWVDGVPAGFSSWDPRRLPEQVEVGHNCIISRFKNHGLGTAQMLETIRRITLSSPSRITVTTSELVPAARKMYERAGFRLLNRRASGCFSGDLLVYEILLRQPGSAPPTACS